ncbi:[protein-PII] uridylyltransferase [Corynebacterium glutamicum]|uniref:[protein-PII] uridylyltransferase n=1 Tax=Corynebacterium glutamicum TaxID=1718 RepID=UPI00058A5659|nr:[protein-PII] uridylyltransferase [Corynebacterium glutamicum]AJE67746.1 protein-PII uridylyltransferase [Corynebacterium glutamicum]OKX95881.1 [protein-PII] uridylyltransferase [Corynebacterium glutamicum]TWS37603.1 protein-PII uridylyltransferase [Corynebacterium glutamicum]
MNDPAQLRHGAEQDALALLGSLALPAGTTLAATGSLARSELTPYSDLDLILIHSPGQTPEGVEDLWYPIWDAKKRLDYSVRTPAECVEMISADSTAALAMLDIRFIAGDEDLFATTRRKILDKWRQELNKNFDAVVQTAIARWRRSGPVVAMTRPDLKHGRGGLRDFELINALALGHLCDVPKLDSQHRLLVDVRTLLHVHARRSRDVLDPEFAVDIALDLGFVDRYHLGREIADAARAIDDALTAALATARGLLPRRGGFAFRNTVRRPLDVDVVDANGTIALSKKPDLTDPALPLRVAAAAAKTGLPVSDSTWARLAECPELPEPWPPAASADFFRILSSPENTRRVVKQMDRHHLWERYVPEWDRIRGLMPREPSHVSTIDEHSLNTVAGCALETVTVARPDLLVLGALYHDIGKGTDRPHEQVGAEMVAKAASRMGLNLRDRASVQTLVAEHTTLAKIASRLDPRSEEAVEKLLDAVHYDLVTLNLLEVLTEADAEATGPGVWSTRLEQALRIVCQCARSRLIDIRPVAPMLVHRGDIALVEKDGTNTVRWHGDDLRKIFSVMAAKGWTVNAARMVANGEWTGEFDVRANGPQDFDPQLFLQSYQSGIYSDVPAPAPGLTATFWYGNILEVRTELRIGAIYALLRTLPSALWINAITRGATLIVQAALAPGFDRVAVERDVMKVLAAS